MRPLARWCFKHKWMTIVAWIVGLAALTALHSAAGSAFSDNFSLPPTQSFDAIRLLQRNAPRASGETDQLVFGVKTGKVTDSAVRARAQSLLATVARQPTSRASALRTPPAPGGRSRPRARSPLPPSPSTTPTRTRSPPRRPRPWSTRSPRRQVACTVLAALTLLPALLSWTGRLVPRRRERRDLLEGRLSITDESPGWARWTGAMQKRPAVFAAIAAMAMVILAVPFSSMRLAPPMPAATRRLHHPQGA